MKVINLDEIRPRRLFSVFLVRKIMRAKHSFRFPNGGGCPFLFAFSAYSKRAFVLPFSSSPVDNFQPIGANFRQKGAKMNFSLVVVGVFSGKSETTIGEILIYF